MGCRITRDRNLVVNLEPAHRFNRRVVVNASRLAGVKPARGQRPLNLDDAFRINADLFSP